MRDSMSWKQFSREILDEKHNPTLCTPRLTPEALLPAHESFITNHSQDYRQAMSKAERFHSFQTGTDQYQTEVDVFHSKQGMKGQPVVVYIHGGWWQWFSKSHYSFVAKPWNDAGMTVYIPAYRLAQDWENTGNPIGEIVTQLKFAIAEILRQADQSESGPVYIMGHSAGGSMAAMMSFVDWQAEFGLTQQQIKRMKGVFPLSGLYDLRPLVGSFVNDAIQMSEEDAEKTSAFYWLEQFSMQKEPLPIYLALPEYDPQEFYRHAREFQLQLHARNAHCDLIFIPKSDHLDMVEQFIDPNYMLTQVIQNIIDGN